MTKTPDFKIPMTHENLYILQEAEDLAWLDGAATAREWAKNTVAGPDQRDLDIARQNLDTAWEAGNWHEAARLGGFVAGAIRYWKGVR